MLIRLLTGRQNIGSRAFFAAALFTIFLIVVTVLPHQHTRRDFGGRTSAAVLESGSGSCALCDWLSTPHLPAAAAAPVVQIPVVEWQRPILPVFACVPGFSVPGDSPQRGPPPVSAA